RFFPLRPTCVLSELDLIALDLPQFRLKVIVHSDQFLRITDVVMPLMENIHPVVKVANPGLLY
ncbi:MAG: hypothetical protein V3W08_04530, partial [Candidatus Binatia bacterium]